MSNALPMIALQTFTVRKSISKMKTLLWTLQQVKDLGINHLELARIPFNDVFIEQVATFCQNSGISVCSTQMKLKEIVRDPAWTVAMHKKLGCEFCVVSVVSILVLRKGESAIKTYAQSLNELGAQLKQEGITLLFHHHNFEFVPIGNKTGFEILKQHLNPDLVGLVVDTYWLQRSGHNPEAFIEAHAGWVKGVHLRDFTLKGPVWNPGIGDAELGQGSLNFTAIIEACKNVGVNYMAIEQNTPKPWHSLDLSVHHLKALGFNNLF